MSRSTRVATTLVGTGRLARSLAPLLARAGHPVVAVVGRSAAAARALARRAPGARATTSLRTGAELGRLVLLAVPDRAIATVARELASSDIPWQGRVVLHHAGALGCEPLRALGLAGAGVGVLHPLQSLGTTDLAAEILPGSRARVEGDARGRRAALRLARALGLVPLSLGALTPSQRTAYHAAASMCSNDLLALVAVGCGLLESLGLGRRRALDALLPLIRGTLRQIERGGLTGPLTGPATRGDVETLRAHLGRLAHGGATEDREIHRLLSVRLARIALEHGEREAQATLRAFAGRKPRRGV